MSFEPPMLGKFFDYKLLGQNFWLSPNNVTQFIDNINHDRTKRQRKQEKSIVPSDKANLINL